MGFIRHSGSEVMGLMGSGLTAYTKRRLSENPGCPTVFVTAFFVFPKLYHVRAEKSNVFVTKSGLFLRFLLYKMQKNRKSR